jgi:hypothetical protein
VEAGKRLPIPQVTWRVQDREDATSIMELGPVVLLMDGETLPPHVNRLTHLAEVRYGAATVGSYDAPLATRGIESALDPLSPIDVLKVISSGEIVTAAEARIWLVHLLRHADKNLGTAFRAGCVRSLRDVESLVARVLESPATLKHVNSALKGIAVAAAATLGRGGVGEVDVHGLCHTLKPELFRQETRAAAGAHALHKWSAAVSAGQPKHLRHLLLHPRIKDLADVAALEYARRYEEETDVEMKVHFPQRQEQ